LATIRIAHMLCYVQECTHRFHVRTGEKPGLVADDDRSFPPSGVEFRNDAYDVTGIECDVTAMSSDVRIQRDVVLAFR